MSADTTRSAGRAAYETDCARRPAYDDGAARKTWDQLGDVERGSWERNPTPRVWPHAPNPCASTLETLRAMVGEHEDNLAYFGENGPSPMPDVAEWHRVRLEALRNAVAALTMEAS